MTMVGVCVGERERAHGGQEASYVEQPGLLFFFFLETHSWENYLGVPGDLP
jgi:hypothetical protein